MSMTELHLPSHFPPVQRIDVHALDPQKANICVVTLKDVVPMDRVAAVERYLREQLLPLGVKFVIVVDGRVQVEFKEAPGEEHV